MKKQKTPVEQKNKPPAEPPIGIGRKLWTTFTSLLFAIGFAVFGSTFFGGVARHAGGSFTARTWQPVMVEVVQAQLQTSRGRRGSTFFRVEAEYRYEVDGKKYTGKRVGFGDELADNMGTWHQERFAELDRARKSGQPVPAWFNPKNPAESAIDRDMLWAVLSFMALFGAGFSAMSLGALWGLAAIWRTK